MLIHFGRLAGNEIRLILLYSFIVGLLPTQTICAQSVNKTADLLPSSKCPCTVLEVSGKVIYKGKLLRKGDKIDDSKNLVFSALFGSKGWNDNFLFLADKNHGTYRMYDREIFSDFVLAASPTQYNVHISPYKLILPYKPSSKYKLLIPMKPQK